MIDIENVFELLNERRLPSLPATVNNRASCASEDKASEVREKELSVREKEEQK